MCVIVILSSLYNSTGSASKRNGEPQFSLWKSWQPIIRLGFWKVTSNTVTRFKIISGLEQLTESQVASWMSQQAFWRELLEGFSQFVNIFIKARQNFIFYFLNNTAAKKFKSIGTYTENTDLILWPSKNYSSHDTVPVNVYILAFYQCIILAVSCFYNKFKQSIYLD
jgi:hypothetical protein